MLTFPSAWHNLSPTRSNRGEKVSFFRYGVIEKALADVLGVKPEQINAFRGRLRHLRNINCPRLPKTGSGQPVFITRDQAIEILIALELGTLGVAPRHAVEHAKYYVEEVGDSRGDWAEDECLIVRPNQEFTSNDPALTRLLFPKSVIGRVDAGAMTSLQPVTPSLINGLLAVGTFAVVNVGRSVGLLDRALRHASTETRGQPSDEESRYGASED
jgi:hypothetical protein